jgi:HEAT repeat protein
MKNIRVLMLVIAVAAMAAPLCLFAAGSSDNEKEKEKGKTANELLVEFRAVQGAEQRASYLRNAVGDPRNTEAPAFVAAAAKEDTSVEVRVAAVQSLTALNNEQAKQALLEIGLIEDTSIQGAMLDWLVSIDKTADFTNFARSVLSIKKDKGDALKITVLRVIGKNEHPDLAKDVLPLLKEKSDIVKTAAVDALSFSADEKSLKTVSELFAKESETVQMAAIRLMADLNKKFTAEPALKALQSKHSSVKVIALYKIFANFIEKKYLKAVLELITDSSEPVRSAAVYALQRFADRDAVKMAIDKLKGAPEPNAEYILAALEKLTGQKNAGYAAWSEWYKTNADKFDVQRPSQADESGPLTAGLGKATYFGTEVEAKRIIFIIDTSKSMSEVYKVPDEVVKKDLRTGLDDDVKKKEMGEGRRKIDVARDELVKCVKSLDNDVKFNVIAYNSFCVPWKDALLVANGPNKKAACEFTFDKRWEPNGLTNIHGVLKLALLDNEVTCIYLLSDGEPTTGDYIEPAQILPQIRELNKRGVQINTIGFGLKGKGQKFMEDLAAEHKGVFIKR